MPGPPRFPLPEDIASTASGTRFRLAGANYHHLVRVLRLREGDRMVLFGPSGEFTGIVERIADNEVLGRIEGPTGRIVESPLAVILFQGVCKNDRMDFVMQKATELGVAAIVPVITERSRSRPLPEDLASRVKRWRRIAAEAAKQTGRLVIPYVADPLPFAEALSGFEPGGVLFWEEEGTPLKQALQAWKSSDRIGVVVGPEGGLTRAEVEYAASRNFIAASMGPRILRTETAATVAVAIIAYELGDMG